MWTLYPSTNRNTGVARLGKSTSLGYVRWKRGARPRAETGRPTIAVTTAAGSALTILTIRQDARTAFGSIRDAWSRGSRARLHARSHGPRALHIPAAGRDQSGQNRHRGRCAYRPD